MYSLRTETEVERMSAAEAAEAAPSGIAAGAEQSAEGLEGLMVKVPVGTSSEVLRKAVPGTVGVGTLCTTAAAVDDSPWTMTEAGRTQKTAECGYCDSAAEVRRSSMGLEVAEAAGI